MADAALCALLSRAGLTRHENVLFDEGWDDLVHLQMCARDQFPEMSNERFQKILAKPPISMSPEDIATFVAALRDDAGVNACKRPRHEQLGDEETASAAAVSTGATAIVLHEVATPSEAAPSSSPAAASSSRTYVSVDLHPDEAPRRCKFTRDDEPKTVRSWLSCYLSHIPEEGVLRIHDIGSYRGSMPVDEAHPCAVLRVFAQPSAIVHLQVRVPSGHAPLQFRLPEFERLRGAILAEVDDELEDPAGLNALLNRAVQAVPGDLPAQKHHFWSLANVPSHFRLQLRGTDGGRSPTEPIAIGEALLVNVQLCNQLALPMSVRADLRVQLDVLASSELRGVEGTVSLGDWTLPAARQFGGAWQLRVLFLPKEPPSAMHPMTYTLRVTERTDCDGQRILGESAGWTFRAERLVPDLRQRGHLEVEVR